jgi:hypothetical protein
VLAKILSAAQKETAMAGSLEQHQIINTHKIPLQTRRLARLRLPIFQTGITAAKQVWHGSANANAVE